MFGIILNINAQIPTNGLVAYWPFNGNANDESGNGNNGTVLGATLTTDRFGHQNSAYNFDGTTNYITVANSASIKVTNSVSISAWVKNTGETDLSVVLAKGNYGSLWDYGLANCWSYTAYYDYNSPFVINEYRNRNDKFNQWHHLAVTVDEINGNKLKLFFDGQEMLGTLRDWSNTTSTDDWIRPTNGALYIGSNTAGFFKGDIDDIRIYNRVLDSTEISNIYSENFCFKTIYDTITTEVFDTTFVDVYDTTLVTVYDTVLVSVTDTLIIDVTISGINPPNNLNTIKVYPNPTKDIIKINTGSKFSQMTDYKIKIISSSGSVIFESNVNKQLFEIDVSSFGKTGLYFIQIIDKSDHIIDIRKILLE